jgi:PAS domain S-box-containing protein
LRGRDGEIQGGVVAFRDITGRKQGEKALRDSTELLEKVFSNIHLSVVYLDREFRFLRVNQVYADACGHTPEFFTGKNHFDLFPHAENEAIFRRVVESGEPFYVQAKPFTFPDHPERGVSYWDWSLLPLKDPEGSVSGLIFCLVDVTDRRQAEMELRALNRTLGEVSDTLRGVIQASPLPILLLDPEGMVKIWNPAAERVFGWPLNEVLGRFLPIVPEDRKEEFLAILERSRQGESFSNLEAQRVRKDGSRLDVLVSTAPLRDAEGTYLGNIAMLVDITSRKQIENALRVSEERFRALVDHSPVGIFIAQEGRIVFQNPEQRRLFGPLPDNFELRAFRDVLPEDAEKFAELCAAVSPADLRAHEMDLRFFPYGKARDGVDMRWVHVITGPMEYREKEAALVIMADITLLKEMEFQFLVREKMAALGHVAAGIAHEIRNPLSGINIHLSALEKALEDDGGMEADTREQSERILGQIKSASGRIEGVIKKVMDFSRPSAPRMEMTDLTLAIEEAIDFSATSLRKSGITLDRSGLCPLPKVRANPSLITQVVMNLITNAAQAVEHQAAPKRIAVSTCAEDGRAVIRVSDSGPGVPLAMRNRIFDPFFTTRRDGYGIGLSLCNRIITDHGGTIRVETGRWGGAEFRIEIPMPLELKAETR